MSKRRVVVTGLGPVTPIGVGATDFWNALLEGRNGIRRVRSFDPSRFRSQVGGEIDGLNIGDAVPKGYRKASKIMARDIVLAVIGAYQATRDAGIFTKCHVERGEAPAPNINSTRFGANIGAGLICADLPELAEALASSAVDGVFSHAKWGSEGMNNLTPLWLLKFLPNMLACHATIVHDAQGPSNTITCAEASSHLAIGEAFRTIERGTADVCMCGGAESKINPMALLRQSLGERLTHQNETPEAACRPFGASRDGTAVSEGGGLVILEELEHARNAGPAFTPSGWSPVRKQRCVQAVHPTQPSADGRCRRCGRRVLRDARLTKVSQISSRRCAGAEGDDAARRRAFAACSARWATPVLSIKAVSEITERGARLTSSPPVLAAQHNTVPAINSDPLDATLVAAREQRQSRSMPHRQRSRSLTRSAAARMRRSSSRSTNNGQEQIRSRGLRTDLPFSSARSCALAL